MFFTPHIYKGCGLALSSHEDLPRSIAIFEAVKLLVVTL